MKTWNQIYHSAMTRMLNGDNAKSIVDAITEFGNREQLLDYLHNEFDNSNILILCEVCKIDKTHFVAMLDRHQDNDFWFYLEIFLSWRYLQENYQMYDGWSFGRSKTYMVVDGENEVDEVVYKAFHNDHKNIVKDTVREVFLEVFGEKCGVSQTH